MTGETPTRAEIRASRPPKAAVAPDRPLGHRWDVERAVGGGRRRTLTVFLAGAECPFTCLFCDLWMHTLPGRTPPGALPEQLGVALAEAEAPDPRGAARAIKLYNASNFFDDRAVPPEDDQALADLCTPFERVTVETHCRLVGERAGRFADAVDGRLEIAIGLETIHPSVLPRLNKGMTLDDFDRAVDWAGEREIGVRAFVLVGLPWVAPERFAAWAARSTDYAAKAGVDRVSLIPLRLGNGALDVLERRGDLAPVTLSHVESAFQRSLEIAGDRVIVEVDPWDLDGPTACPACADARIERLRVANLEQVLRPPPVCDCGSGMRG